MEVSLLGCADRDEQMSNGWSYPSYPLLNDEQMSNKVRVEHQPAFGGMPKKPGPLFNLSYYPMFQGYYGNHQDILRLSSLGIFYIVNYVILVLVMTLFSEQFLELNVTIFLTHKWQKAILDLTHKWQNAILELTLLSQKI